MPEAELGIFGGSGFYELVGVLEEVEVETPYGRVSFGDGVQTWVNPRWPELQAALTAVVPQSV